MTHNPEESLLHGEVTHLNPETLHKNPAFTQVITVTGPARTIYIGGQDSERQIVAHKCLEKGARKGPHPYNEWHSPLPTAVIVRAGVARMMGGAPCGRPSSRHKRPWLTWTRTGVAGTPCGRPSSRHKCNKLMFTL